MPVFEMEQSETDLMNLVELACAGEDVILSQYGQPLVRLVPIEPDAGPRQGGQWAGQVYMADDFDELPENIARAFGMDETA